MANSIKTISAVLWAAILLCCCAASAQDIENDPLSREVQALYESVNEGMEPFSTLADEYFMFAESVKDAGLAGHDRALAAYLETMALAGRSEMLLEMLQKEKGGASHAHDLAPALIMGPQTDMLAQSQALRDAYAALNAFLESNPDRRYTKLFFTELAFQFYLLNAQAGFVRALDAFNSKAPGIEAAIESKTSKMDKELAMVLIVLAAQLGQNTRAIAYYEKYKPLLEQIQDPELALWPYERLAFAYTVTGNRAMADAMRARIAALRESAEMGMLEGRAMESMPKMADTDSEIYYYEADESIGGSGSVAAGIVEPPPEVVTTMTVTNITRVQADQLLDSLWGLDGYLNGTVEAFDANSAVLRIVTTGPAAAEIAAFLNRAEYPGFVIRAEAKDENAIQASALGIARQQFNALLPVFDFVVSPQNGVNAAPALEYMAAVRAALRPDAPPDLFRDMLFFTGEAVLLNYAADTGFFDSPPAIQDAALSAFPDMAILLTGTYGLALSRSARHAEALAYFSRVHEFKDKASADIARPLVNRSFANEIAMGVQTAAGAVSGMDKASAALEQLKSSLDGEGESLKLTIVQAGLHYKSEDYEKALSLYGDAEQEAARYTNLGGVAAHALLGRGNCAIMLRRHAEAAEAFSQTADLADNALLKGTALSHLARVRLFTGGYAEAQTAARGAADIADQFALFSLSWQARYTLGRALEAQDRLEPALEQYRAAADAIEASTAAPEIQDADAEDLFRYAAALCARMKNPEAALQFIERGRAYAMKTEFLKSAVAFKDQDRQRSAQQLEDYQKKIEAIETRLETAAAAPPADSASQPVAELKKSLHDTQREYIKFVTELERTHPELASLYKIEPLDLVKIRKDLPPDMAVVSYVIGDDALYIFLVRADRLVYRESPLDGDTLTAQIKLMRSIISNPRNADADSAARMENFRRGAARLYDILIKPVAADLEGVQYVGLLPNGILNFVPFQALVPSDGTADYLVRGHALFYLDSLSAVSNTAPVAANRGAHLFAFGNADETLPAAEREVDALKSLFTDATVFLRHSATESQAKSLSEKPGIFHFATHGALDFKDISQSYITLAPDAGEDGRFTIEEVWGYWWGDSALVALSACSTALGELTVRGKAVNPAGAFLNAGAPSVLASLWNVDDAATAELMRRFYENLSSMKKADALRAAQIALMGDPATSHPYYWAPFMLIGDWR